VSRGPSFEARYADGVERFALVVGAAALSEPDELDRLSVGLAAGLELLAAEPELARLITVEVLSAGHSARLAHEGSLVRLGEVLCRQLAAQSGRQGPSEETARLLAGGLVSHVSGRVLAGETGRLTNDHDLLLDYLLTASDLGQ
jgi:AcrR family transcriptional regulator